jgi:hypothetical protein
MLDLERIARHQVHLLAEIQVPIESKIDDVLAGREVQALKDAVEVVNDPGVVPVDVHLGFNRFNEGTNRAGAVADMAGVRTRIRIERPVVRPVVEAKIRMVVEPEPDIDWREVIGPRSCSIARSCPVTVRRLTPRFGRAPTGFRPAPL